MWPALLSLSYAMRKSIFTLIFLMAGAFLTVIFLAYTAPAPNRQLNGFDRHLLENMIMPVANMPDQGDLLEMAGATHTQLFFSTTNPQVLISTDLHLQHPKRISFPLSKQLLDTIASFYFVRVDSPAINIFAYNMPEVISTTLYSNKVILGRLPAGAFSQAVAGAGNTFMLRKGNQQLRDQQFARYNALTGELVTEKGLSELYGDGGMCTDGRLSYDSSLGLYTYVYFYANRFFTFDSSFHVIQQGHTIDTTAHFRFTLNKKTAAEDHVLTSLGPSDMVNGASCVYKGTLFVHSKLKGDNEKDADFKMNTPIDMYNLRTGAYKGSFYLPLNDRDKLSKLTIVNGMLYARCKVAVYAWLLRY